MKQKIYFSLLTLCTILSEGIGSLSEENIEESSNLHVRKKRVVDRLPQLEVTIQDAPYVVNIRRNGSYTCMGSILAAKIIITNGECISNPYMVYSVWSGSSYLNRGFRHKVVERYRHPGYRNRYSNNLGILEISPPIDFLRSFNREIVLYTGIITPNTLGTITGWGCSPEQRNAARCAGYGDAGAPLVVNQHLVGVMAWSGGFLTGMHPDVFVNLSHPLYRNWIDTFIKPI